MQIFKIIILVLTFLPTYGQAQSKQKKSDQTKIIEINNEKGELSIAFTNNVITEFIVNDKPISKDRYSDYQAIIDDFSGDEVNPVTPTTPDPPVTKDDNAAELWNMIVDHLSNENLINSETKYKVQLKQKYLKVNGQKLSNQTHQDCLEIFQDIYGHRLNSKSVVNFRKSKNNYKSSIKIAD